MLNNNKRILFYNLVIFITLTILFILGELLVRLFLPSLELPKPPAISTIDPYKTNQYIASTRPFLFFHLPHTVYNQARSTYQVRYEINSLAFRGAEIPAKKKNIKRLLIIGDSIVEGHGNEFNQTFSYLLNKKANKVNWEIINVGVQGASPIYYLANLERYLALEPDAILLMIYENDIFSDDRYRERQYFDLPIMLDKNVLIHSNNSLNKILSWSKLYRFLRDSLQKLKSPPVEKIIRQNLAMKFTENEQKIKQDFDKFKSAQFGGDYLIAPELFDKYWGMTQLYLDAFQQVLSNKNIKLLTTVFAISSLEPDRAVEFENFANTLEDKTLTWAKNKNIPALSLLPVVKLAKKQNLIFHKEIAIKDDGHPTAYIHAEMAKTLEPFLLENLVKINN
jgi:lysophospholipase L1-like esterase